MRNEWCAKWTAEQSSNRGRKRSGGKQKFV